MTLYLYRLFPPRPKTFAADRTRSEALVMTEHAGYWQNLAARAKVVVFGPVADPEGVFGIAVICAEDGEEITSVCDNDPAIKSAMGFTYKLHLMPQFGVSSKLIPGTQR